MLKENLSCFFKKGLKVLSEKSPEILLGVAIFGSISSVCMAVKVTPEAHEIIIDEVYKLAQEKGVDIKDIKLKWTDYVRLCWRVYLLTGVMLTTSIIAMVMSNYIRAKRAGALATAFALTQETLRTYQNKVIEEFGKKKEEKIRDEVAKEKLKNSTSNTILLTGNGNYLFFDAFSGRYFRSNIENVRRAQNDLNAMINQEIYASVNDFYGLLDIPPIQAGDSLGWSGGLIDINFSTQISDKDHNEEPCIVIDFHSFEPFENYKSLHR